MPNFCKTYLNALLAASDKRLFLQGLKRIIQTYFKRNLVGNTNYGVEKSQGYFEVRLRQALSPKLYIYYEPEMEKVQYKLGELTRCVHMSHHITLEWSIKDLFVRSWRQEQLISTNFYWKDFGKIGSDAEKEVI